MIRFMQVSKQYEGGNHALQGLDFTVQKGEMVFLTGHSGAGKSTLLKLIMRIEQPTQGHVFIDQQNLSHLSRGDIPHLRRRVSMIFQTPTLLQDRSLFHNVSLPLVVAGYHDTDIARRTRAALDKVGLLKKEKCLPIALSTGEQQRAGIARAIVNRPQIVLADEPTGNLDPALSKDILSLLHAFSDVGVTVMVATHDLALIAGFNCNIMELKSGQLVHHESI